MLRFMLAALAAIALIGTAQAQSVTIPNCEVVSTDKAYTAGQVRPCTQTTTGRQRGDDVSTGNVAAGATDSGNPVKVGGVYNSTQPTLTNGQRGDGQLDSRGNLRTTFCGVDTATCAVTGNGNDGGANNTGILTIAHMKANNGSTGFDSWRNNSNITVLASAARTTTTASSDLTNYNGKQAHIVIDVTAIAATPSVVCTVQGKDAQSSQYYTILTSAAITGVSTTVLRVGPGLTAAANTVANDFLPRTFRVNCVHGDADSITYSIGASLVIG